jgi:hypothetical protein
MAEGKDRKTDQLPLESSAFQNINLAENLQDSYSLLCTIIKLYSESGPLTISQLLKCKPNSDYMKMYRALKSLEDEQLIIEEKIDGFLFFYPSPSAFLFSKRLSQIDFYGLNFLNVSKFSSTIDLTQKAPVRNIRLDTQTVLYNLKFQLEYNSRIKASRFWWEAQYLIYKLGLDSKDLKKAYSLFRDWLSDINLKVLVFETPQGEIITRPYYTRFNSLFKLIEAQEKYDRAWEKASVYSKAVFITITLPPPSVIPLKIQKFILSIITHRIKARLRRRLGFSPPHISVNEPQKKKRSLLSFHRHLVIFGVDFIDFRDLRRKKTPLDGENDEEDPKRAFTIWLDETLQNILKDLGRHIKTTVNKNLSKEDVEKYNELGKYLLSRYLRYKERLQQKAKKEGKEPYTGPINWLTRLNRKKEGWVFENPPPDAIPKDTDGGELSASSYLMKYLGKTMRLVSAIVEGKKLPKRHKLVVFYWLLRIPFYTLSPKLRDREKKVSVGWKFLGSLYVNPSL